MDSSPVPVLAGRVLGGRIPDGPVTLWFAVTDAAGAIMGAARMPVPMPWRWQHGRLCAAYSGLRVIMTRPGWYAYGVICAVSGAEQVTPFMPLWRVSLGKPQELRAGDDLTVAEGVIAIIPDPAVPGDDRPGPSAAPGPV
jgi:hypothetical protein